MLSDAELAMLTWFARYLPLGPSDALVDAGAFLGGSSSAMARGLKLSGSNAHIHSYDMFVAPRDEYSLSMIGRGREPGASVLDIYESNLGADLERVVVHEGDFLNAVAPDTIGLLFIDIAKTWDLNAVVVREFFPRLMPGRSIVIQQDHNTHSCPWVNFTMEWFSDYFERLCDQDGSRVYLCRRAIPDREAALDLRSVPLRHKLAAVASGARRAEHPDARFMAAVSSAWLIFEERGLEEAEIYLQAISPLQPWRSDQPYADDILRSMRIHGSSSGLDDYAERYFRVEELSPASISGS